MILAASPELERPLFRQILAFAAETR